MIIDSVLDLIGETPLLDLSALVPEGGARLFAKLEYLNPGGSIKDRAALAMIEAAEEAGVLRPGMTVVEPTAGNMGIGLAIVCNVKGYKTVFIVPDRVSEEKLTMMRLYGAEIHLTPGHYSMNECHELAQKYADEHGNCFIPNQFKNTANPTQAECFLGPDIYRALGFYPDGLAIGAGSGGTFTGLSRWLKEGNPLAICWLLQPKGSIFGGREKGCYQVEGIGNSFIPNNLDVSLADHIEDIEDEDSFKECARLALLAGVSAGGSSGANMVGALRLCEALGAGKTVVTVFPDSIERYISRDWVKTAHQCDRETATCS